MSDELVLQLDPPYVGSAVSPTVDITETTTDVTVTITDFRGEHSYSVEKTGAAIADAEAAAAEARQAASDVQGAVDAATQAAQSANTAAGTANTAAQNADAKAALADSKAALANQAATTANQAAQAAEAAKTAANTAAGQATTAAGNANTAAGTANTAATNADAKAALADTAAANADTATANANTATTAATNAAQAANNAADYAIEAADDMPKLVNTASGTTAQTVNDAWPTTPESAVLYGESVQDGTPTPDNPVPVQVVGGINVWDEQWEVGGISSANGENVTDNAKFRSKNYIPMLNDTYYFRCGTNDTLGMRFYNANKDFINSSAIIANNVVNLRNLSQNAAYFRFVDTSRNTYADDICINVSNPDINGLYLPYGCIGLQIGETITPIDLQGHTLASLPGGTRDVLRVDSTGNVTLLQNVGVKHIEDVRWLGGSNNFAYAALPGVASMLEAQTPLKAICDRFTYSYNQDSYRVSGNNAIFVPGNEFVATDAASAANWFSTHETYVYYLLAEPQTIELGTIELPELTNPCELAIYVSLDPEWAIEYEQDPNIVVTALQSSIAPVEGGTASTNYAVNSYLIHANQLYRVTSAIATGEAITPGTNCVACTVMGEVIRLTA